MKTIIPPICPLNNVTSACFQAATDLICLQHWPGRAGKLGKGVLVLSPFEEPFLKELEAAGLLSDCPVDPELSAMLGAVPVSDVGARLARWRPTKDKDSSKVAAKAYQAFLGCDNDERFLQQPVAG